MSSIRSCNFICPFEQFSLNFLNQLVFYLLHSARTLVPLLLKLAWVSIPDKFLDGFTLDKVFRVSLINLNILEDSLIFTGFLLSVTIWTIGCWIDLLKSQNFHFIWVILQVQLKEGSGLKFIICILNCLVSTSENIDLGIRDASCEMLWWYTFFEFQLLASIERFISLSTLYRTRITLRTEAEINIELTYMSLIWLLMGWHLQLNLLIFKIFLWFFCHESLASAHHI